MLLITQRAACKDCDLQHLTCMTKCHRQDPGLAARCHMYLCMVACLFNIACSGIRSNLLFQGEVLDRLLCGQLQCLLILHLFLHTTAQPVSEQVEGEKAGLCST